MRRYQLAILRSFTSSTGELGILSGLSPRQWQKILYWLDISGLALYFFDHMRVLNLLELLPAEVSQRLQQNLKDNTVRMNALASETSAIQQSFTQRNLNFALLKGFSLVPHSVPSIELRSQLDSDFLIAPSSLDAARDILEQRGYHLYGQSGRSWEYKDEPNPRTSIRQLYTHTGSRCAELHVANTAAADALLQRHTFIHFCDDIVPVLAPEDLFLGQAIHYYKHLASDGARAAHGLELYRHIMHRFSDDAFWERVRVLASDDATSRFALGFVIALMTKALGEFAPEALASWTSDRLPNFAHRWIDGFGLDAALGRSGGSKLAMILQDELIAHGMHKKAQRRGRLVPTRLPPRIEQPRPDETAIQWIGRHYRQVRFVLYRLRFHLVEGLRLAIERFRWKHTNYQPQQTNDNSLTHA